MPLRFKTEADYRKHVQQARRWPTVGRVMPTPQQSYKARLGTLLGLIAVSWALSWLLT